MLGNPNLHLWEVWVVIWCTLTVQNNEALAFNTVNRKPSDNGGCRLKASCRPLGSHARRIKVSYSDMTEPFFWWPLQRKVNTQYVWRSYIPSLEECVGLFFIYCLINSFVSIYCWRKSQKMNADIAMEGVWRRFHRVFNLAELWEIKGPSDVLPVPLKMHRASLLICLLLPFSLCAHWSLWSGESVVPIT